MRGAALDGSHSTIVLEELAERVPEQPSLVDTAATKQERLIRSHTWKDVARSSQSFADEEVVMKIEARLRLAQPALLLVHWSSGSVICIN